MYKVRCDLNSTEYRIINNLNKHKMNLIKTLTSYALYTLLCLVLFSCSDKQTRCYVCEQSESLQAANFVSKNIKGANNMSDEEMEDVIAELRKTGIKLYCKQVFVPCTFDNQIIWEEVKKDSLQTFHPYLY